MAVTLSLADLGTLPEGVARPSYDREDLSPGILHFGVGNFHRAHQAVYLDRLFRAGEGRDWAIVGAGVMPGDAAARTTLAAQDFLTTVVEQSAETSEARVTGAMIDYLDPGDVGAIVAKLTDPAIRIASLTITEGGYFIDAETGRFDPGHPAIAADGRTPDAPKTVFGLLVAGLQARRESGQPPFTIMSCDNIPHNGSITRNAVAGLARLSDPALADWIEQNVAFPSGMVDRITPATGDRERAIVRETFGVADNWPVFCEDFIQWVLEDDFPQGRPALETVGVQFVPDVAPFETMKLRILNGGHAVIAYPAGLLGIHFVHEAMEDEQIRAFLAKITSDEIIPAVPPVPETDLETYAATIEARFANPKIGDTVRRLCLDGSNRQPKFIVPTIADRLNAGQGITGLALESALWCRYCAGTTEAGETIEPNDPAWDRLVERAEAARSDPSAWLGMQDVYGAVGRDPAFADAFAKCLGALYADGVRATLAAYLEDTL
ncbi:mannitol dehydrogenase family protein [Roseicyclus sp. F158]|uniref:Mannitol dehydrogenase family protein n=1 Tax=Tropicimonas omnivorans TaxID=3075590 RepID=A0ABU3DDX0_9RHOB|nr:mannitol dehydrogenase family protein [Roseicyclus sp. F158]MDT0681887.1 mannitol dehydrogenase family protein [Roseicyclus sp. F158]